jgi:hypothetical protein
MNMIWKGQVTGAKKHNTQAQNQFISAILVSLPKPKHSLSVLCLQFFATNSLQQNPFI